MSSVLFVLTNSALNRGMNTGLENLAWGLAERGVRVHILTGGEQPEHHGYSLPDTVSYHFTDQSGENPASFLPLFEEIVHEHPIEAVVGWIINTALLANSPAAKGIRFIANLGQMPPRSVLLRFLKQALLGRMGFGEAFRLIISIYRYASICHLIISNSDAVKKKSLLAYGLVPEKCLVVRRGVDTDAYVFRLREGKLGGVIKVLFAGNISEAKGIGDLVQALCLLQVPIELRLCGPASKDYIEQIVSAIEGTPHRIEHMGPVGQKELISFYRQCDLFVFPSHSEGMPKALLEAMSCGCPVVCSDIEPHKEVIENAQNGLMVPVRSPQALADAIEQLIDDSALREKCSQNARETVEMSFSKESEIDSWMRVLQGSVQ